jgi:TP901 family phage tail tape measure protein
MDYAVVFKLLGDATGFTKAVAKANKDAQSLQQKMAVVGSKMRSVGSGMTTGVTLPIIGIGVASVAVAAKFETSMNQVQSATNATAAQIKMLEKYAKDMGAATMFSAKEAADAMLELGKGGMTPAQIRAGALKATMDLAAASGMDLATSAVVVTNAMNTFGLSAKTSTTIASAFAGAANASSADVDGLAESLAQVGATARNVDMTIEQTLGTLALFADNGIKGSDAGTSLKVMLSRLIPMTDKQATVMDKLNLSFVDNKGNIDDIFTVAQKLHDTLGPLTEKQRLHAISIMFGSDAQRAATILMREGAKGLEGYVKAAGKRDAAEKMAKARTKGTAGALERLKGSVETLAISIGKILAPFVQKVAKFFEGMANNLDALSPRAKNIAVILGLVAAAIGPLLCLFGGLISIIGTLATTVTVAGTEMTLFSAILGAVFSPVALTIAAIAGLIAIMVVLYKKNETFREAVDKLASFLKSVFVGAFHAIVAVIKWVIKHWRGLLDAFLLAMGPIGIVVMYIIHHWDKVKKVLGRVWEWLKKQWDWLVGIWKKTPMGTITGKIIDAFRTLKTRAGDIWNGILRTIARFVNLIGGVINKAFGWAGINVPTVNWGQEAPRQTDSGNAGGGLRKGNPSGGWDALLGNGPKMGGPSDRKLGGKGFGGMGRVTDLPKPPAIAGPLSGLLPAVIKKVWAKLKSVMKSALAMAGGDGYGWAQALASKFGLTVSSTYRPGAITAAGYPSDHGVYGRAADIAGPWGAMSKLWEYIKSTAGNWKQAIFGHQILNHGVLSTYGPSDHMDHLHIARNYTPPGGRGGPRGDDSRLGGDNVINVYLDGALIERQVTSRQTNHLKQRMRRR